MLVGTNKLILCCGVLSRRLTTIYLAPVRQGGDVEPARGDGLTILMMTNTGWPQAGRAGY